MWTVEALGADLASGRTTSRALTEEALARIQDPAGEGARAFMQVNAESARAQADHADRLRKSGVVRSPVDGLPVSLKDLFDVGGEVTRAGSKVLAGAAPAKADAPAVARLRAAGAVFVGRTNMVEFAFGAVGTNPHYGTPKNPWDRKSGGRVPGGSSSGAAVSVADGMCLMGLGSDTRGSIRQPAALCGVAGFKPTMRRVPREGAFPLSYTLDSIGPLANSVACCAAYDAVLAGETNPRLAALPAKGLRLLVPRSSALEDLDPEVAKAFEAALAALGRAGAQLEERKVAAFDRQGEYFKSGGFAAAEAFQIHRRYADRLADYDPRVAKRVGFGKDIAGWELVELGLMRQAYIEEVGRLAAPFDAFLMPSSPCVAPTIAEASASDEAYFKWNGRILRNTGLINFLDGCAASVPCHAPGSAPVGLMVCGVAMTDRHVLAAARAIEAVLSKSRA
ncbi:MAG TPA: amidase [Burkholderiales bacterium]|jgi:aspartyl-tRNA(Asn)/glutamyl-tRNA(Gln) amidotransferase subunit A|nr:amidase [Burkholderiales bacterium]